MEFKNPKIDAVSVVRATDFAIYVSKAGVKHAIEFTNDEHKAKRLVKCECKAWFYFRSGRIGGAAMSSANCGICDVQMGFPSTNVDKLCNDCGEKYELCVVCGGDIKMRPRRVFNSTKEMMKRVKKLTKGVKIGDINERLDPSND